MSQSDFSEIHQQLTQRRALLAGLGGLAAGALVAGKAKAGPLDPPMGPIASTGKTLTEVEPRIAINATNTPGDANSIYRITQPGSYYLTENVTGESGKHGIEIAANSVSIDLMGFALLGAAGSLSGVVAESGLSNVAVRNGVVSGWGSDGVNLSPMFNSSGFHAERVTVSGNGMFGLRAGANATVSNCIASNNGFRGIDVGEYSIVEACLAIANPLGIKTTGGSQVSQCVAKQNSTDGIDASGIITQCVSDHNGVAGFRIRERTLITDCVAHGNGQGVAGAGVGIACAASGCRIERNSCTSNGVGIYVYATGNFIVWNTCSGNTVANWDIIAGNKCLVSAGANSGAIYGNSGGVSPGSTHPYVNFTF